MTLEELKVVIDGQTSGLKGDISNIKSQLTGLDKSVGTATKSITSAMKGVMVSIAALGIGKLFKDATSAAMGVQAATQQIARQMGSSASAFTKWADESASAFNMSRDEAIKYGSVYGNLISGFTSSTKETMAQTQNLLKASAVIAAGTGRTMEDTMERIRSGMLGNTEAIEDLGVMVGISMIESTDAFKRFANGKSWNQLSFQMQQQIRLAAILEQTQKKYGDTVANNVASQQAALTAELKNTRLNLGEAFLPIYSSILPALTSMASQLASVTRLVSQFTTALFGTKKQTSAGGASANATATANNKLAQSYTSAGKAAKSAVAGFDEVNTLMDNSATGGAGADTTGAGASIMPDGSSDEVSEVNAKMQELADSVRGILGSALDELRTRFEEVKMATEGFRTQMATAWTETGAIVQSIINTIFAPALSYMINDFFGGIARAVTGSLLPVLGDMLVGASQILNDLLRLVQTIWFNAWGVIQPGLELYKKIIIDTLDIIKSTWDKYGADIITNVRSFIQGVQETFQLLWDNVLNPIIQPFLDMLNWLWDEHLKGLVAQVIEFVAKLVTAALEIYNGFIKPIVDYLIVTLGPSFAVAINFITDVIGTVVGVVADVAKGVLKSLGGIIDFITGVFTGNWSKAWQGVKDIFSGIWDAIVGVVKGAVNIIIDLVNMVIRSLNTISISVPDWVPGLGGKSFGFSIPTIPKLARGGIIDQPTVAMVGERGPEAVIPLENTSFVDKLASAVGSAVLAAMNMGGGSGSSSGGGDVVMQIDGSIFARIIGPYLDMESTRAGNQLILKSV